MAKDTDDRKTEDQDGGHSLDMSQAAVKKMIAEARERGYITYDQLNGVLPPEQVSSEQIEDVMTMLSEMGINIIDNDEVEEGEENRPEGEADAPANEVVAPSASREVAVAQTESEKLDRTDDPVRMYLREMGSVELLSREGEIAIAKRIEAGRNTMIAGLCESPLTFQAITIWRDELLSEDILLRDVIDLEATFGNQLDEDASPDEPVVPAAGAAEPAAEGEPELDADGNPIVREEDDDDDDQANMSLAAMEAALKPDVLATLDRIADDYARLAEMQDLRISAALAEYGSFGAADEAEYQKLRSEIVALVNELHLHNNRIEALIDQLYGINRRIMSIDSRHGEARRPGPHQPPRVRGKLPRPRARPVLDGAHGPPVGPRLAVLLRALLGPHRGASRRDGPGRPVRRRGHLRVPPHRAAGPEGREGGALRPRRRWSRPTSAS